MNFTGIKAQSYAFLVEENNNQRTAFSVILNPQNIQYKEIKTKLGYFTKITLDETFSSETVGLPQLPTLVKIIEVPFCDSMSVVIRHIEWDSVLLTQVGMSNYIYPSQPSVFKTDNSPAFVIDSASYLRQTYYPSEEVVRVNLKGVMRQMRMAELQISPILYHPVRGMLKIIKSIQFEIVYHDVDADKTLKNKQIYSNNYFTQNTSAIVNPNQSVQKAANQKAPIKYIIVSDPMFKTTLQPFIQWKKQQGFMVVEAYTDQAEVGNTKESIKTFLKQHYTQATLSNPAQTFVLFVGDVAQIPSYLKDNHITDLYYCEYTDDYFPECYYGRFSAQNISQLEPQIQKTLQYEKYTMPNADYLNTSILVAGSDATYSKTHANGEINYIYNNYINTIYGYSQVYKYLYNASGKDEEIRSILNKGIGIGIYTAHCDYDGWNIPTFKMSHISAMNNADKYGVLIGNCCLSNRFDVSECFGEALLRAPNKGCAAYIGATDNTIWDEDYYWAVGYRGDITANPSYDASKLGAFDKWFHYNNEPIEKQFVTVAGIIQGGNLSVQATNSEYKKYYWEIYHVMGDPSLMPWLKKPLVMNVDYPASILIGTQQIKIEAAPNSYIALLADTGLITATFANIDGRAILNFESLKTTSPLTLVVTAQNYQFFTASIQVTYPEGPILNIKKISIYDTTLQATSKTCFNQKISLDMIIENQGIDSADSVYIKLYSDSPYLQIEKDSIYIGSLSADTLKEYRNQFQIQIKPYIPDSVSANLNFVKYYRGNNWMQTFELPLHSAAFKIMSVNISDSNNTYIKPNETVQFNLILKNTGSVSTGDYKAVLKPLHSNVTGTELVQNKLALSALAQDTCLYNLKISESAQYAEIYPLLFTAYNDYFLIQDTFYLPVGQAKENFETGNFDQYSWVQGSQAWEITTKHVYEGNYAIRSKTDLSNDSSSVLEIVWTSAIDDSISFYHRISSEEGYDYFKFMIDNEVNLLLSGYSDTNYARSAFFVPAGTHCFKFLYQKDYATKRGYDAAFIDDIIFPRQGVKKIDNQSLEIVSYELDDSLGNHNQHIEYNESVFLNLTLKNQDSHDSEPFILKISSDNSQVRIETDTLYIPSIKSDSTYSIFEKIQFKISELALNQTSLNIILTLPSSITLIPITIEAPDLAVSQFQIETSNGNSYIEPDEDVWFKFTVYNKGLCSTGNLQTCLSEKTIGMRLTDSDTTQFNSPILANDSAHFVFKIKASHFKINFYPVFDFILTEGQRVLNYNFTKSAFVNLSIEEAASANDFKLYPNPAKSEVEIISPSHSQKIKAVKIYNMSGQMVKNSLNHAAASNVVISVSTLPKGIYLMEIYDNQNYKIIKKLIKQ